MKEISNNENRTAVKGRQQTADRSRSILDKPVLSDVTSSSINKSTLTRHAHLQRRKPTDRLSFFKDSLARLRAETQLRQINASARDRNIRC